MQGKKDFTFIIKMVTLDGFLLVYVLSIYLSIYGSTVLCLTLAAFSVS
jgi:hypothetical protein